MKKIIKLTALISFIIPLYAMEAAQDQFGLAQNQINRALARAGNHHRAIEDGLFESLTLVAQNKEYKERNPQQIQDLLLSTMCPMINLHSDTRSIDPHNLFGDYYKIFERKIANAFEGIGKPDPNYEFVWHELWRAVAVKNKYKEVIEKIAEMYDQEGVFKYSGKELFHQDLGLAKFGKQLHKKGSKLKTSKILKKANGIATRTNLSKDIAVLLKVSQSRFVNIITKVVRFLGNNRSFKYFFPNHTITMAKNNHEPIEEKIEEARDAVEKHKAKCLLPLAGFLFSGWPGKYIINPSLWFANKATQITTGFVANQAQTFGQSCMNKGMSPNKDYFFGLYCREFAMSWQKQKESMPIYTDETSYFIAWYNQRHTSLAAPQLPFSEEEAQKKAQEVKIAPSILQSSQQAIYQLGQLQLPCWKKLFLSSDLRQGMSKRHNKKKRELEEQSVAQQKLLDESHDLQSPVYWAIASEPAANYLEDFITRVSKDKSDQQKKSLAGFAVLQKEIFQEAFKAFYQNRRLPFFQGMTDDQFTELFFATQVINQSQYFAPFFERLDETRVKKEKAEEKFKQAKSKERESQKRYQEAFEKINQAKKAAGSWLPSFLQYESIKNALYKFWGGSRKEQEADHAWQDQGKQEDKWREKYHAKEKANKNLEEAQALVSSIRQLKKATEDFRSQAECPHEVINGLGVFVNPVFNSLLQSKLYKTSKRTTNLRSNSAPLFSGEIHTIRGSQQQAADCGYYALSHAEQLIELHGDVEFSADAQQIEALKKKIGKLRRNSSTDWLDTIELRRLTEHSNLVTVIGDIHRIKQGAGLDSIEVLQKLSQLQKDLQNNDSVIHVFILGNMQERRSHNGHWVPFVVRKENGKISYYTANSLGHRKDPIIDKFKELLECTDFSNSIVDEDKNIEIQNCCTTLEWVNKIKKRTYNREDLDRSQVAPLIEDILDAADRLMTLTNGRSVWTTAGFINSKKLITKAIDTIQKANGKEIIIVDKGSENKQTILLTEPQNRLIAKLKSTLDG